MPTDNLHKNARADNPDAQKNQGKGIGSNGAEDKKAAPAGKQYAVVTLRAPEVKGEVIVSADPPDLQGKRSFLLPTSAVYTKGSQVTFTLTSPARIVQKIPNPLAGTLSESYTFASWWLGEKELSQKLAIRTSVETDITLKAVFVKTSAPWVPDEAQAYSMAQQLKLVMPVADTSSWLVIYDGQPLQAFKKLLHRTKEDAMIAVRALYMSVQQAWLRRLSPVMRAWVEDPGNNNLFFEHWSNAHIRIIGYDDFIGTEDSKVRKAARHKSEQP